MPQTYFLRLLPPRPTFVNDMTDAEREVMNQHVAYVRPFFQSGELLLFGPVLDPAGSFGIAVMQVENEERLNDFIAGDPSVKAGLNRYLPAPMVLGGAQGPRPT